MEKLRADTPMMSSNNFSSLWHIFPSRVSMLSSDVVLTSLSSSPYTEMHDIYMPANTDDLETQARVP